MRARKLIGVIVVPLVPVVLLLVTPALAQSPALTPRRLTFDGHSTPLRWDESGLLFTRPGSVLSESGGTRIANELWRVNPADGRTEKISADVPLAPRSLTSRTPTRTVTIKDGPSPAPELWLTAPDGSNARLLLKGDGEYFGTPIFSPDGTRFVFVRTPTGNETHALSSIWVADADGRNLSLLISEAAFPVWPPDGSQIAFEHHGDVYVGSWKLDIGSWKLEPPTASLQPRIPDPAQRGARSARRGHTSSLLAAPTTIRVYHTQANADFSNQTACRDPLLAVGTIVTMTFETYVSWVVPTEISASNPTEQLKTQAVAARTYAWRKILDSAAQPYDVTDWTDTQAMCELREDPRSNTATAATAHQYVAFNSNVIVALYSAENGDPTMNSPFLSSYPYLHAVDDPVSFGRTRNGHGQGMSQNGAYRWALWYGWDYIQILTHYYTGVTIEGPTNFGSLTSPWQHWYLNSNRARISGNASNGNTLNLFAHGLGLTNTLVASHTLSTSLDLTALPDQPLGSLLITATLSNTQVSTLTLGIDRVPPTGTFTLPLSTTNRLVTVQVTGTDSGPSGFAGYGLSNNWVWEGEDQFMESGVIVTDVAALNGRALKGRKGIDAPGSWFGPYTYILPVGEPYRAYFRLKTDNVLTTSEIAYLDVVADANTPIGVKPIYGTDFREPNVYQEFSVDFNYVVTTGNGMEFRVKFDGNADLWLDRILVATYPINDPLTTTWRLPPGEGLKTVIAKFSDNAQNVSADVARPIPLTDTTPPYFVDWPAPSGWLTSSVQTLMTRAGDEISGLNVGSATVRVSQNGGISWSQAISASVTGVNGTADVQSVTATVVFSDGANLRAQFQIADMKGFTATSSILSLMIDSTPPTASITSPLTALLSFTVTWSGADALSGLASFDVQSRDMAGGMWQDWLTATLTTTATFTGEFGHRYQFRVRARDQAGNVSNYSDSSSATTDVLLPKLFLPLMVK